jgi:acyl-CoA-binding protein
MKIFNETEKVIAEYKERVNELELQEQELQVELNALQEEHTALVLDQENANLSEKIYLKSQAKEVVGKSEIVNGMIEEIEEEKAALRMEFTPLYKKALDKDSQAKVGKYNINSIVDKYRYEMMEEIAGMGKQMADQYHAIAPDIHELFKNEKVIEAFPQVRYGFNQDHWKPTYEELTKNILSRNQVNEALSGYVPASIPKPKDVN